MRLNIEGTARLSRSEKGTCGTHRVGEQSTESINRGILYIQAEVLRPIVS